MSTTLDNIKARLQKFLGGVSTYNIVVTSFAPSSSAIVESSPSGELSATKLLIPAYITDVTIQGYLENVTNWTGTIYTGPTITGTYLGQKHVDTTYLFECVLDNIWARLIRG